MSSPNGTSPQNLKEFFLCLKSILGRNISYNPYENSPPTFPYLTLQLYPLTPRNGGPVLLEIETKSPTLNPTWPVSETTWLNHSHALPLASITRGTIRIFSSDQTFRCSYEIDLLKLALLEKDITQLTRLPVNTIIFEFCNGQLMVMSETIKELIESKYEATPSHIGSAISMRNESVGSGGLLFDAEDVEALEELRRKVLVVENEAKSLKVKLASDGKIRSEVSLRSALVLKSAKVAAEAERNRLRAEKLALGKETEELAAEVSLLRSSVSINSDLKSEVEILKFSLEKEAKEKWKKERKVQRRRYELVASLRNIYPIRFEDDAGGYLIRNVPLDLESKDEETLSAALGYTAHLTALIAKYLKVSLRYHIHYGASRSAIRDSVKNGTPLALFRRGAEAERFERAVAYLSRNVDQLLSSEGLLIPSRAKQSGGRGSSILVALQFLIAECAVRAEGGS